MGEGYIFIELVLDHLLSFVQPANQHALLH